MCPRADRAQLQLPILLIRMECQEISKSVLLDKTKMLVSCLAAFTHYHIFPKCSRTFSLLTMLAQGRVTRDELEPAGEATQH